MIQLRTLAPALTLTLTAALTGCAGDTDTREAADRADSSTGYPLTVTNCGHEVTLEKAPERIVAVKSTSLELLLALGLEKKVVGYGFPDGPVPEQYADAAAGLTKISDKAPGNEAVLELEPDLVFAGWESNLAADTAGERDLLDKLGVASYVSPAACQSADAPKKMTFDLLFDQILETGRVLGAADEAAEIVADQKLELGDLGRFADGTSALWWSSGVDTPFVGGGTGAPQMVMDAIGLTNVAGDVDDTWTSLGWEAIVDADPDVIVLVDAPWNTAESKIAQLETNPATEELSAVTGGRFLIIPFPAGEAGIRSVSAASDLVARGTELGLTDED